jgi:hypothetical protein
MRTLLFATVVALNACAEVDIDLNTKDPRRVAFDVRWDAALADGPQDGRLVLILSTDDGDEPRFQVSTGPGAQPVFGRNVTDWEADAVRTVDASHRGFPYDDLAAVPPGEYRVQAVLNRYEDFELVTGHVVSLPPDRGEGQKWNRKPGNLYSTPRTIELTGDDEQRFELTLDQAIPPIEPPADTPWVKHVRMRSERLSEFWGRDVYLGAHVLLPKGYDEHPEARYPLMVFHGHFPDDFGGFRPDLPIRTWSRTTASASAWRATTASSRRRPTPSTSAGPATPSRAS